MEKGLMGETDLIWGLMADGGRLTGSDSLVKRVVVVKGRESARASPREATPLMHPTWSMMATNGYGRLRCESRIFHQQRIDSNLYCTSTL